MRSLHYKNPHDFFKEVQSVGFSGIQPNHVISKTKQPTTTTATTTNKKYTKTTLQNGDVSHPTNLRICCVFGTLTSIMEPWIRRTYCWMSSIAKFCDKMAWGTCESRDARWAPIIGLTNGYCNWEYYNIYNPTYRGPMTSCITRRSPRTCALLEGEGKIYTNNNEGTDLGYHPSRKISPGSWRWGPPAKGDCCWNINNIHPWKLTWNPNMKVWKIIFLFKLAMFRFYLEFCWWLKA